MRSPTLPLAAMVAASFAWAVAADPLPSWSDGDAKAAIIEFVERVTDPASPDYVTPDARIATFDNDGTLWTEQPMYFQVIYAVDRLQEKAAEDPSILTSDALRAAAEGDYAGVFAAGEDGVLDVLAVSHGNIAVDDFQADVTDWLESARHPQTGLRYDQMVYQPMLELLRYLRDEDFKTWIVSGGGIHFIRAFAAEAYNIPPSQVIGSSTPTAFDEDTLQILKEPGISFVDDKAGKPVAIDLHIGMRPILVGGNSDGDFQMLDFGTAGEGPFLGLIVHHTDADREFAYDRDGPIGTLNRGLDEGPGKGWLIVDMANDWTRVWPRRQ